MRSTGNTLECSSTDLPGSSRFSPCKIKATVSSGWHSKLGRVTQMNWDEVRTRVAQALHKRGDLARHQFGFQPARIHLAESAAEGKFFFARAEVAHRTQLLRQHLPDEAARIVREADEICAHHFRLLGYDNLDYSGNNQDIDWHLDAVHKKRAPLAPWFRIPYLDFKAVGDHKVIWELNRHQHLVTLAKAWLLTGDQKYVRELIAQWRSWIKANPYPLGMNWSSTLEVAFRSLSWLWVDHLLADAPAYSEFRAELIPALAFHGRYIERYLSTYFSPNTHLLGEAVAMFFLGTLYPQMPHAARWKQEGWQVVLREAGRQVRPDGVYFEQALHYHVYALDFFLYSRMLAAANDFPVPAVYDDALGQMLTVLQSLSQAGPPEGFGDDDGGRVFNPRRNQTEHMTDPLALGALVFNRHDLWAAQLTEESIWLFGDGAIAALDAAKMPDNPSDANSARPTRPLSSVAFRDGGIYVLTDSSPCPQTMMVDAGPQGAGRCGHGHADALSIRFTMNGERWLVDSGTGVYASPDPRERDTFRGTAAHNTLRVDGVDQAVPAEPFSWTNIPNTRAENWLVGRSFTYFSGSHDGYTRMADPVTHKRAILRVNACGSDHGIWLVRDVVLGAAEHDLELNWHFAGDVSLREAGANELLASKLASSNDREPVASQPTLRMIWPDGTPWKTNIADGQLSPAYGRFESAPLVRSEAHIQLPTDTATAFLVGASAANIGEHVSMSSRPQADAQLYEVRIGAASHQFVYARGSQPRVNQPWTFGPWSSDAELLYCRTANEKLVQLIVIGATSLSWQGRSLLPSAGPFEYLEWRKLDGTLAGKPSSFSAGLLDELADNFPPSSSNSSSTTSSYAEKR